MRYPIVDVSKLKRCLLWEGSSLEVTFRFQGGLPLEDVKQKHDALARCDDRTPAENELLAALKATIEDPMGLKEIK